MISQYFNIMKRVHWRTNFLKTGALVAVIFLTYNMMAFVKLTENQRQDSLEGERIAMIKGLEERISRLEQRGSTKNPKDKEVDEGRSIQLNGSFHRPQASHGCTFNSTGWCKCFKIPLIVSQVHTFSPTIENIVSKLFVGYGDNTFMANSPAFYFENQELVVVFRMWLQTERFNWPNFEKPKNFYQDNFLYTVRFDRQMRMKSHGHIIGIPSPKWAIGDGPLEPRMFKHGGQLYVTYNLGYFPSKTQALDYTFVWDYNNERLTVPTIVGGIPALRPPIKKMPRDKHWIPLTSEGELYFIYTFDPLRVMWCSKNFSCQFVIKNGGNSINFGPLRGGTPFVVYKWPYYISMVHGTFQKTKRKAEPNKQAEKRRVYTANLLVMSVDTFRIVYISEPIKIHDMLSKAAPIVRGRYIEDPFIFPVGIHLENDNDLLIGAHVNDFSSALFRIRGIKQLMSRVIQEDSQAGQNKGPPTGAVENYMQKAASMSYKYNLERVN